MTNIYKISILSSFIGLWVSSLFSETVELILGYVLIFSFGIIHGANDILLIDKINSKIAKHNYSKILLVYLISIGLTVFLFYLIPMLALILFVIYSAYHFGEQHWQRYFESTPALLKFLFFTSYGLTILGLIFILNPEEVSIVVRDITGINYSGWFLKEVLIIAGALTVISYTIAAYKAPKLIQSIPKELFLLLIFALIFHSASLIWGFTIYFIFWHSIPSLCDQVRFIHKDLSVRAFKAYGLSALPYWLVSMGGLVALYMLFNDQKYFISLFFAFIAAVTFPHTLVIAGMFNKNNTD